MVHGEPGGVYNVCSGKALLVSDVLRRLMEIAGTDVPVWLDPDRRRPADVAVVAGDPHRIKTLTGWQPEIPLERTLADVLATYEQ